MDECGQNIGVVSQLERSAMRGDTMPDGLTLTEQKTWQALSYLYGRYRLKLISREDGGAEKKKIIKTHESGVADDRLAKWTADLRRDIEAAQNAYRKDRSLENADGLSMTLDGLLTKK